MTEETPKAETGQGTAFDKAGDGGAAKTETKPDAAPPVPRESGLQGYFELLSRFGPSLPIVVLAFLVWPAFWGNGFYCPPEVKSIQILHQVMEGGSWLAPAVGDYVQWPGYSLLFAALGELSRHIGGAWAASFPLLLVQMKTLCSLLALVGLWTLGQTAGLGARAALAGGLLLLCSPFSALLTHFMSPGILASGLTLFSLACFCRGWQKEISGCLPAGFLFAGLAALTGGLYYLLLPLAASAIFLGWFGRLRRVQKADALLGFALCLGVMAVWLAWIILHGQAEGYLQHARSGVLVFKNPLMRQWWLPQLATAAGLLPWLALVLFVSWGRVLRDAVKTLKSARAENAGTAFVWIALGCAIALSLIGPESAGPAVMAGGLAALLLGKALLRLSHLGSRFFYAFVVLSLVVIAIGLPACGVSFSRELLERMFHFALPVEFLGLTALVGLGICFLVAAALIAFLVRLTKPGGALCACCLLTIILAQPAMLWLAPQVAGKYKGHLLRYEEIEKTVLTKARQEAPAAVRVTAPEPASSSAGASDGGGAGSEGGNTVAAPPAEDHQP